MNFMDAVKVCFTKYADFNGRAKRPEFWWFVLFCILGSLVLEIAGSYVSWAFSLATLSTFACSWRTSTTRYQQKRLATAARVNPNFGLDLFDLCLRTTRRCWR
jgi:hypothetical protein